jgi:hypothetical protein
VVDGAAARPERRVLSAHQSAARLLDRDRRVSAQACLPVLVPAHARRGLRVRSALTHEKKIRRLELQAGAAPSRGGRGVWSTNDAIRKVERDLALQAQRAYERTLKNRQQKKGASATSGRDLLA